MSKFVEAEGLIHLCYGEFTLCGDAFDLASDEPGYEWRETKKKVVTCTRCILWVEICCGVRTHP